MTNKKAEGGMMIDPDGACPKCAEYREALEAVRWRNEYGGFSACAVCGWRKTYEERHSPTCKIGRLFAKEESQHV